MRAIALRLGVQTGPLPDMSDDWLSDFLEPASPDTLSDDIESVVQALRYDVI